MASSESIERAMRFRRERAWINTHAERSPFVRALAAEFDAVDREARAKGLEDAIALIAGMFHSEDQTNKKWHAGVILTGEWFRRLKEARLADRIIEALRARAEEARRA